MRRTSLIVTLPQLVSDWVSIRAPDISASRGIPEAVLLQSKGRSVYARFRRPSPSGSRTTSRINAAYTWSRSKDENSVDPGSAPLAAGSPMCLTAVSSFRVTTESGQQLRAVGFRSHAPLRRQLRLESSCGLQAIWIRAGQSGVPYSIVAAEPETSTAANYTSVRLGSGGLYRLGFGRPSLCGTLDELQQEGSDPTEQAFNASVALLSADARRRLSRQSRVLKPRP